MSHTNTPSVVAIGVSAEGSEILQAFLSRLPADTQKTFVVIQTFTSDFKSITPTLLTKASSMPVVPCTTDLEIKVNCVYINTPGTSIILDQNLLKLSPSTPGKIINRPIDIFFNSLAESQKEKAMAVVLAGEGSDGSIGVQHIKELGGMVLAQKPTVDMSEGLPCAAIKTGVVDVVASVDILAKSVANPDLAAISNPQSATALLKDGVSRRRHYEKNISRILEQNEPCPSLTKKRLEQSFINHINLKNTPSLVFTDSKFKIRFIQGDIIKKLSLQNGVFDNNLLTMLPDGLASTIRAAATKVYNTGKTVKISKIKQNINQQILEFDIQFSKEKVSGFPEELLLMQFSQDAEAKPETVYLKWGEDITPNNTSNQQLVELEATLIEFTQSLEELETSHTELQFSNEKLAESNQELQQLKGALEKANQDLEAASNDINHLLESTDIATIFLDSNLNVRKFTAAIQRDFSLQQKDIGKSLTVLSKSFTKTGTASIIKQATKTLNSFQTLVEEVDDAHNNAFLVKISPFITREKQINGVVINFININNLKATQHELKRTTQTLNLAYDLTELAIWEWDVKNDYMMSYNPYWETLYEFDRENVSEQWNACVEIDDHESANFAFNEHLEGKTTWYKHEFKITTQKTNTVKHIINRGQVIQWNDNNEPEIVVGVSIDVSESRLLAKQLQHEKLFVDKIAKASPNGIYIYDFNSNSNTYINKSYEDILGYTLQEINSMPNQDFMALFHKDYREQMLNHMQKLRGGEAESIEYRFKDKSGKWRFLYSTNIPFMIDKQGRVNSFIGSFVDITESKHNERKMRSLVKKARLANSLKNQFLANMSHEIRTPMNGILGLTELIKDDDLASKDKQQYIEYIQSSCQQLLRLINDIIDISKIESGQLNIITGPCKLNELMKRIHVSLDEVRHLSDKTDLRLNLKMPKNTQNLLIETDGMRLEQVLTNLINNAIKFSSTGDIDFGYRLSSDTELEFFVKDDGIGIPKEKQKIIFKRFEQAHNDFKQKIEGTGLGLAISLGIIETMGGKMHLDSEYGIGSTFTFTIPLNKLKEDDFKVDHLTSIDIDISKLGKGKKMLIAEDQKFNNTFFKALFEKSQFEMLYAENGQEALKLYKTHKDIDLTLMDIRMPKMSGDKAAEKILKINPKAKIIAQTAFAMQDDESKFMDIGFTDYLSKPINKKDLLQKVYHYTEEV